MQEAFSSSSSNSRSTSHTINSPDGQVLLTKTQLVFTFKHLECHIDEKDLPITCSTGRDSNTRRRTMCHSVIVCRRHSQPNPCSSEGRLYCCMTSCWGKHCVQALQSY